MPSLKEQSADDDDADVPQSPLDALCKALPKIELHAHLHGSLRLSTLAALAELQGIARENLHVLFIHDDKSLSECFAIFGLIHKIVTDVEVVKRITQEVLEDMQKDNVRYAEIRTTPRALQDGTTRQGYVEAVLEAMQAFEHALNIRKDEKEEGRLIPRLLLSIDRSGSLEEALETVKIAIELTKKEDKQSKGYIVGLDFSGNPTQNSFLDFEPAFRLAREHKLKITIHTAEVDNDKDTAAVLAFRPERLGHALFLKDATLTALSLNPIPIEICPTSNMKTLELSSHSQHPTLERFLKANYPISINTDDSGVFDTSSSQEHHIVANEFNLSPKELYHLSLKAIDQVFAGEEIQTLLRRRFEEEAKEIKGLT